MPKKSISFYRPYFSNLFLNLKIQLKLKEFPFIYSYDFLIKLELKKLDIYYRKKLFDFQNEKNRNLKILKFLLAEMMPTVFLEGFKELEKLSEKFFFAKKQKNNFYNFYTRRKHF